MHYKSGFNALIMPCNAPYNALYNLLNNCNNSYSLQHVSIHCYTMHLKFSYNYLPQDIMYYNAHYE